MRCIINWFLSLNEFNKRVFIKACIALMLLCGLSSVISFVALIVTPTFVPVFIVLTIVTGGISFAMFMIIFAVLFNNH